MINDLFTSTEVRQFTISTIILNINKLKNKMHNTKKNKKLEKISIKGTKLTLKNQVEFLSEGGRGCR